MAEPTYTVTALGSSTWAAFAALVERSNGIFGGCWCMGFHPEDSRTDAAHNRAAREQRVRMGHAHAALVFDGDDCAGWCQFGAPDEVSPDQGPGGVGKGRTTSPGWRVACCYAGKGHRRQGVATAALAGALDLIAGLGGGGVEGYPGDAGPVPGGFLFNGALSTCEKLGFTRDRKIGKHRWVVAKGRRAEDVGDAAIPLEAIAGRARRVPGEAVNGWSPRPGLTQVSPVVEEIWRGSARQYGDAAGHQPDLCTDVCTRRYGIGRDRGDAEVRRRRAAPVD